MLPHKMYLLYSRHTHHSFVNQKQLYTRFSHQSVNPDNLINPAPFAVPAPVLYYHPHHPCYSFHSAPWILNLYKNSIHQLYNALNHDNNTLHHQSTHLKTFSCTLYRASHPPLQQHAWFHNPAPVFWHRFPGLHLLFLSGQLYFRPMACQSLNQIP